MKQIHEFRLWGESFARNTRGTTAMMFALALLPIAALIGVALDFQRASDAKVTLQQAIDVASLAGARTLELATSSDADVELQAVLYFNAAIANTQSDVSCDPPGVLIDRGNDTVAVSANCNLPTTFGALMGHNSLAVSAASASQVSLTKLDLALMLDVSGSMSGSKISDLRTAAKDAIDILMTDATGDRVRIGFNAYSTSVNAGSYASAVMGPDWSAGDPTCASERTGWAAFKDDEPGASKWIGNAGWACPSAQVAPLTTNRSALKSAIDGLSAGGWTAGHLGVAWSWYIIAPDWDDIWPAASAPLPYTEPKSIKAVILMTDGAFNTEYETAQGTSYEQADDYCDAMKAKGVIVYSVAFQAPLSGQAALAACASSSDHYFNAANGEQLKDAYQVIASQLAGLRITQ